jgi:hypothetical protein
MMGTSIPLLITLDAGTRFIGDGWGERLIAIVLCLVVTGLSLLPGFMYLNARTWNVGVYRPLKLGLLGVFFISYLVLAIAAFSLPVSATVLRLAGIYSNEIQTFAVLQPSLADASTTVGLTVRQVRNTTLVDAYVRYGFGGIRLLCRRPLDPLAVSEEAIKDAKRKKAQDPTMIQGAGCVQASPGELRPLRM